jgi:hypothetical protein
MNDEWWIDGKLMDKNWMIDGNNMMNDEFIEIYW